MMSKTEFLIVVSHDDDEFKWELGTVDRLAFLLKNREQGDYAIAAVMALRGAEVKPVQWTTEASGFNEADYGSVTVAVRAPSGAVETSTYTVDGRA